MQTGLYANNRVTGLQVVKQVTHVTGRQLMDLNADRLTC